MRLFSVVLAAVLLVGTVAAPATAQTEPTWLECETAKAREALWKARVAQGKADKEWRDSGYKRSYLKGRATASKNAADALNSLMGWREQAENTQEVSVYMSVAKDWRETHRKCDMEGRR